MMVNPAMMKNSSSGGMMGGGGMTGGIGMMGNSSGSGDSQMGNQLGGGLTLSDVHVNDNIQLLGYQDITTGDFVVTYILVWLY